MLTLTYIKNCIISRSMKEKTPYKVYYGKRLNISHLWELGCHAKILTVPVHPIPKMTLMKRKKN